MHDALFMPDSGTARCDFPDGSAALLWNSIQRILALPDEFRVFVEHDYCIAGRASRWKSTVAEQKATNVHIAKCRTQEEFVALREVRDRTLPIPHLILFTLQVNRCGGQLPVPGSNEMQYLKFPLGVLPDPETTAPT